MNKLNIDCQYALLLRYSDIYGIKTIKEHERVLKEAGFCWFGKIGKRLGPSYIEQIKLIPSENRIAFLYTTNSLHMCNLEDITYETPNENFPIYYKEKLFKDPELRPSVYFKLTSITSVPLKILENYVVASSGKEVFYDLKNSISSFYLLQDRDSWVKPKRPTYDVINKKKEKHHTYSRPNVCTHMENGKCTNKHSVNYSYECERPKNCIKFKAAK